MAKVLNNTQRLITVKGAALVPTKVTTMTLFESDLTDYPFLGRLFESKELTLQGDFDVNGNEEPTNDVKPPSEGQNGDEEPTNDIDFEEMTVSELKAYAVAHHIDLGEATKKADIIAVIRG